MKRTNVLALVAANLKTLRQATGLTQAELAERAETSVDAIRRIESERMSPTVGTIGKLARGLGVAPDSLLRPTTGDQVAELRNRLQVAVSLSERLDDLAESFSEWRDSLRSKAAQGGAR
jgi:transcriptional regulator with XRE-family HTH domain